MGSEFNESSQDTNKNPFEQIHHNTVGVNFSYFDNFIKFNYLVYEDRVHVNYSLRVFSSNDNVITGALKV